MASQLIDLNKKWVVFEDFPAEFLITIVFKYF